MLYFIRYPKSHHIKFWACSDLLKQKKLMILDFPPDTNCLPSWLGYFCSTNDELWTYEWSINPLTPNDHYRGRTAPLKSKRCILYIYWINIGTAYFEHCIYSTVFFSSKCSLFHNSNVFGSCIIHILYTECAKIKKIIPAPKGYKIWCLLDRASLW